MKTRYLDSKNTDSNTIKTAIKRSTLETKNTSISMVVDTYYELLLVGKYHENKQYFSINSELTRLYERTNHKFGFNISK